MNSRLKTKEISFYNYGVTRPFFANAQTPSTPIFFDIFIRDSTVYAIGPSYPDDRIDYSFLKFQYYKKGVITSVKHFLKEAKQPEGFTLLSFPIEVNDSEIRIDVTYQNTQKEFHLPNLPLQRHCQLGVSTIFKDDHQLIPTWQHHLRKSGVDLFILYDNRQDHPACSNTADTVFIDWPFDYYCNSTGWHHAQVAGLHHARLKFLRPLCMNALNIDLDEIPILALEKTLLISIEQALGSHYDVVEFENKWAFLLNYRTPRKRIFRFYWPVRAAAVSTGPRCRTKYAYRTDSDLFLGVHHAEAGNAGAIRVCPERFEMLHFANWSNPWRQSPPEPCEYVTFRHPKLRQPILLLFHLAVSAFAHADGLVRRIKRRLCI